MPKKKKEEVTESKYSFSILGLRCLASSGSVVPLFKKQILNGGHNALTHKEIVRYFMTISEAAQLVLIASSMSQGGDVFLLDMGEPVKIISLAEQMIKLSGLKLEIRKIPTEI